MSSRAVHIVATEEEKERLCCVIRTRIRQRCDMLHWDFCFEKHVVVGKEGKKSPRHRRDMNVHSVWSGSTCVVGCGRSDVGI